MRQTLVLFVAVGLGAFAALAAGPPPCDDCELDTGQHAPCLPCLRCGAPICCATVSTEEVEKTCWEVEERPVCIPAVRFPWQKSCDLRPGRVRWIKVLVEKSYPAEEIEYDWSADQLCPRCAATGGDPVDAAGQAAGATAEGDLPGERLPAPAPGLGAPRP